MWSTIDYASKVISRLRRIASRSDVNPHDGCLSYSFSVDAQSRGSMLGLFSSAYLTSKVADSAAEDVADCLEKHVTKMVSDQMHGD